MVHPAGVTQAVDLENVIGAATDETGVRPRPTIGPERPGVYPEKLWDTKTTQEWWDIQRFTISYAQTSMRAANIARLRLQDAEKATVETTGNQKAAELDSRN